MILRAALPVVLVSLLAGCVSSGDSSSMTGDKGRSEAREAYVQLGLGYLQQGMTEQAKIPLRKALELDKADPDTNAALALVFQSEMEFELAEQAFRTALNGRPGDARILNNYGSFLFAQQRYQEERAANRQQRQELRPDDAKPCTAVKYRLREADKMGSWHSQHYVLHRLRHAFTRCRTTREHL